MPGLSLTPVVCDQIVEQGTSFSRNNPSYENVVVGQLVGNPGGDTGQADTENQTSDGQGSVDSAETRPKQMRLSSEPDVLNVTMPELRGDKSDDATSHVRSKSFDALTDQKEPTPKQPKDEGKSNRNSSSLSKSRSFPQQNAPKHGTSCFGKMLLVL